MTICCSTLTQRIYRYSIAVRHSSIYSVPYLCWFSDEVFHLRYRQRVFWQDATWIWTAHVKGARPVQLHVSIWQFAPPVSYSRPLCTRECYQWFGSHSIVVFVFSGCDLTLIRKCLCNKCSNLLHLVEVSREQKIVCFCCYWRGLGLKNKSWAVLAIVKGTISPRTETFNRAWNQCPSLRWTQWLKITGSFMQQQW